MGVSALSVVDNSTMNARMRELVTRMWVDEEGTIDVVSDHNIEYNIFHYKPSHFTFCLLTGCMKFIINLTPYKEINSLSILTFRFTLSFFVVEL